MENETTDAAPIASLAAGLTILKSLLLFAIAGLCEIGGGYLMWQWLRHGKSLWYAVAGAILLVLYGVLPNFQPSPLFGRVYTAYGGIFIVLSLLWAWRFDGDKPDRPDLWGAALCLIGVCVLMYWPRR